MNSGGKMAVADLLTIALGVLSIPTAGVKVLDCCAGDGQLAFDLLPHFGSVSSNDLDTKARVQTHYDVRRPEFWQSVHGAYDYIITKPPTALLDVILHQALEHCSLVAFLIPSDKQAQLTNLLTHKSPTLSISVGSTNHWVVWVPSLAFRGVFVDISDNDVAMRTRVSQDDYQALIKERVLAATRSLSHQSPAAAAAASPFMSSANPFGYPQSQFQSAYPSMGFGYGSDPSFGGSTVDPYHFGGSSPYVAKRDPSVNYDNSAAATANGAKRTGNADANSTASGSSGAAGASGIGNASAAAAASAAASGTPSFVDFASLTGYPSRHPSAAAYAQPMLPYYARAPAQPPSPTQAWHFQQAGWPANGFSAAQLAGALGSSPTATHVPGAYHPGAPQFNPAAILMDMDKFTQQNGAVAGASPAAAAAAAGGNLGMVTLGANGANSRSFTESTTTSAGSSPSGPSIGYGLHKPTAFKAGANAHSPPSSTSPGPMDDQLMLSQAEMLYLKGVHAAKQGKALEVAIDKYRSVYSKKDVITKVCKMKYRSAQRKLRIAKHIQRFPEISTMTQRQAERYISEKLRKSRGNHEGRSGSSEED